MNTERISTPTGSKYRFEAFPRLTSVYIYDQSSPDNYIASCQVLIYGDVGIMYSISGQRFYDALAGHGLLSDIMAQLGIASLHGYVMPSHARLLRMAFRDRARVEQLWGGVMGGRKMSWIRVANLIND